MKSVIVIGGGIAGVETANQLSILGHKVLLLEKDAELGGKINNWHCLFPNLRDASEIKLYINKIADENRFAINRNTEIVKFTKNNQLHPIDQNGDEYEADAVVLATGFKLFRAERKEEYGYNIYKNVITSADLERKFNEKSLDTKNPPKRIAIVHCVGSRDEKSGNHYCSKVCCITGVKQAIELKKTFPEAEIICFYMDLRMHGKGYEELYREAQEKYFVQFIRGRVSEASENIDKSIQIKAEDTLSGKPLKMTVDMMVLLVGMEMEKTSVSLVSGCNVEFGNNRFFDVKDEFTQPNSTLEKNIFVAGACSSPMNISEAILSARSTAVEVHKYLELKD